jgi:hypothetical protein
MLGATASTPSEARYVHLADRQQSAPFAPKRNPIARSAKTCSFKEPMLAV